MYIFFLGVATSFSLPPYNFWFLNFLTFSLLIIFLIKNDYKSLKAFSFYGYSFGFGYFFSNLYWIPLSLLHDENFKFLIPIAMVLIPAFLSLFYGLAFLLFRLFLGFKGVFVKILLFSIFLGLCEFIRGTILSGFPWNLFAYSFSENLNYIQINSLIGIYAFNTKLITLFSVPSILYLSRKRNDLLGFSLIVILALSTILYGTIKIKSFDNLKPVKLSTEIKVLSTAIPIERFYLNVDNEKILKKLIKLSEPEQNKPTIFIWPEGIISNTNFNFFKNEYDYLLKKSFSNNHTVILGINDERLENEKIKYYNSLSIIDSEVELLYQYKKNKLVPFGEFLPFERILTSIGLKVLTNNYQSYSSGLERELFNLNNEIPINILPLICYEIIYSGNLSNNNEYNFIINISEDGWFGNSIGPHQHFAHSIFRSIEYGKYTLRSANNGISAIVDPSGSVIDKLDINSEGTILLKELVNVDKTLFSSYENKIYFLIILLYIFLIFSFKKLENE